MHGACFKVKEKKIGIRKWCQVWFSDLSCGTKLGTDFAKYSFTFLGLLL